MTATFAGLRAAHPWRPIRGCPGRFALAASEPPEALLGGPAPAEQRLSCPDPVVVVEVEGGGLISYHRPDGTWVHTLGDAEGFPRKLARLVATTPRAGSP